MNDVCQYSSYRVFLKAQHEELARRNPRWSLRAFASRLGVSPSALSEVLSKRKNFSVAMGRRVAARLGLSPRQSAYLVQLVELEGAKDPASRADCLRALQGAKLVGKKIRMRVDEFRLIADWYHFALHEAFLLAERPIGAKSLAEFFGLPFAVVADALDRLERMGFLEKCGAAGYRRVKRGRILVTSAAPNAVLRRYHREMLELAERSLGEQSPAERYSATETFAFAEADLARAGEILDEALDKLLALSASGKKIKDVYHVGAHLFRLNRKRALG